MSKSYNSPRIDSYKGLQLDTFQREAIEAIARGESVIVAAPTGAGKTLIAEYALDRALKEGKKIIYTSPIKALSNQKYRDFSNLYPGQVGVTTGDVSIRPDAPVVIMTTEIFRNTIFESPHRLDDVSYVIFDEIHFMDDKDRGTVWEESLIFAPEQIKIVALSATVSNLPQLTGWLESIRPGVMKVIIEKTRPIPLEIFIADVEEGIRPFNAGSFKKMKSRTRQARRKEIRSIPDRFRSFHIKLVNDIHKLRQLPCLFFLFSRKACERIAESCCRLDFYDSDEDRHRALNDYDDLVHFYQLDERDEMVSFIRKLLSRGISFHHAGLLPVLKEIVEQLFGKGHVRMLFATETFALGVNMPARSVAFEGIRKFDGTGRVPLLTRQFMQMAGRAGRRGMDMAGSVYVTFDPILDDANVARDIILGEVEPIRSQFNLSYATLLNLYKHLGPRIFEACKQSFANYCGEQEPKRSHVKKGKGKRDKRRNRMGYRGQKNRFHKSRSEKVALSGFAGMIEQVRQKLDLLTDFDYVRPDANDPADRLTEKGHFAAQIYGSELAASEILYDGLLDQLSPEKLAVVFTALVYESRPDSIPAPFDAKKHFGKTQRRLNRIVSNIAESEKKYKIRDQSRGIDWNLSGVVWAWAKGETFDTLRSLTNVSDGDVVRTLRQTLQLMRMVSYPLKRNTNPMKPQFRKVGQRISVAMDMIRRDLVDAEWQLRVQDDDFEDSSESLEDSHYDDYEEPDRNQGLDRYPEPRSRDDEPSRASGKRELP
ncbi:MAG: DEAD/DEAH box helicase, partial [Planctomycetota bacterium]|nr:DEAD/DEAH box helicase [Planctomycetota bacterium]